VRLLRKITYIAATYPGLHPGGLQAVVDELKKLLGEKLIHWSVAVHPSKLTEAFLHTSEYPTSLKISGPPAIYQECTEATFFLHALLQVGANQKLPRRTAISGDPAYDSMAKAMLEAESVVGSIRKGFENEERRLRIEAAPVRFGDDDESLEGPYVEGVYITQSSSITPGITSYPCSVEVINRYYRMKGCARGCSPPRRSARCIIPVDVPLDCWTVVNELIQQDDITQGGKLFRRLESFLAAMNAGSCRGSPSRQGRHFRTRPGRPVRRSVEFYVTIVASSCDDTSWVIPRELKMTDSPADAPVEPQDITESVSSDKNFSLPADAPIEPQDITESVSSAKNPNLPPLEIDPDYIQSDEIAA
jgi:hypothetical protein